MRDRCRGPLKEFTFNQIMIALNHLENAYAALDQSLKCEKELTPKKANELYEYGIDAANFHKVKLANIKKAILSITGQQRYKREQQHAVSEMPFPAFTRHKNLA